MAAPFRCRFAILPVAAMLVAPVDVGAARTPDPTPRVWVTDNWASSIAADQGVVYVGGYFHVIAPYTGGGAVLDLDRGELSAPPAEVDGLVYAVAPDGGGGWFIGGDFRTVGDATRRNLAHIDGSGHVSDWSADVSGPVSCLLLESGRLFVGGTFSTIGGVTRTGVAAVDLRSGAVLPWDARVEGQVFAMARHGKSLYLGGRLLAAGGESRGNLAALDAATGALLPWNPAASGAVHALTIANGTVFLAGESMTIGGATRTGLAAVDAATGNVLPWNPVLSATGLPSYARSLAISGTTLYVAGFFDHVNGVAMQHAAAVDLSTGELLARWNPQPGAAVKTVATRGSAVYLGGEFTTMDGVTRYHAAAVDAADGHPLPWDPSATGQVLLIAIRGNDAFVGGWFEGVGGRPRAGIAAIDAESGRIHDWAPDYGFYPQPGVDAVAAENGRVFASGSYPLGGLTYLVWSFDPQTRSPLWEMYGDGGVSVLALEGNTLYFGGLFASLFDGTSTVLAPRHGLAAMDATTSRLLPWDPAPYRDPRLPPLISALAVSGPDVYVGGFFAQLGGASRPLLGAVDAVTGSATNWVPSPGHWGKAIAVAQDRVFTGMPGSVSSLNAADGTELWKTPVTSGTMDALATDGRLVFAAGTFASIDGQARSGLAALDVKTGRATSWDPDMNRFAIGLAVSGGQLFGVGRFGVYSVPLPATAMARHAGTQSGTARPSLVHCTPVTGGEARITLAIDEPGPVNVAVFDLQGRRIASVLDHAWLAAGTHEQTIRTADWPRGLYFVRVDLAGHTETHRIAVIR